MDYALHLAVLVLIWATLGLSQGLISGYLGILAIHQAAAWGIGAYTAALLNRLWGLPLGVTLIPGAVVAGSALFAITALIGRGRRDDQVIASLCVQVVVVALLVNLTSITGGPLGIAGIEWGGPGDQRARVLASLGAAAGLLAATAGLYVLLSRTRLPREWLVMRDDRAFAESIGVDAGGARSLATFLAAASAGAAGTIFAHYATFIEPSTFGLAESVAILAIATVGRAPNVGGVLVAALVIVLAPEVLRNIGLGADVAANVRQGLFGLLLIVAIFRLRR
ncbi:MAG: branched-chain amino acid ABC transporter permease [Caulobacter sp.]|nr:branched-chain amino acid ABC transporter permease [Caulobacter sp.]